ADVDALGPRRDPRQVDLGGGLVRVVLEEVVLGRPVVLEADGVAELGHLELAQEPRVFVVPGGAVHLREDPELHGASLRSIERSDNRCSVDRTIIRNYDLSTTTTNGRGISCRARRHATRP